jgi:hypothetical protein
MRFADPGQFSPDFPECAVLGLSITGAVVRVQGERHLTEEKRVTRYLLSVYQPDGPVPEPEVLDRIMADLEVLNTEMRAAGAWVFAAGLHPPSTATVVRTRDGEVLMTDGPYTEGKEHVGGFTVVDAPDLDAALGWAARLAEITTLPIEVRPFRGDPGH